MELNLWNSILEKVKPHIPTINSNPSSPEDEGIVTIFQRPAGLSLKVPDDIQEDSFPMEDAELEELLKPFSQTCWSEENCSQSVKSDDDDDEIEESTTATHLGARHSGADAEASARETNLVQSDRAELDTKSNVDNRKSDKGFPVLSFAMLDQWDLDDVLQNLKEDELLLQQGVSREVAKVHADGDKVRSQRDIMEKLVAFCKSQSDLVKSPNNIRQNNVCNKSSENTAAELQLSHQECPTVYIDLRCPDPSIKPPRTSPKLSSDYKSPAKHNTHQETPPAKKPNLKVHIGSRVGDREGTGKSMLLQKIREMNGNRNKYPKEPKQEKDQQQRRTVRQTSQHEHQQILKELKIHRPTKSVREKQPAAEKTDVLYDYEASYLQPISILPTDNESKGCMLLSVSLSSPGMVESRSQGKRKYLDPLTKANVYNTLVAWFLSLVGPDPRHDEYKGGAKVPFWVAGLQQLWTEDGLALHVLAAARHSYTPRKRDTDIHAPFHKHVCRFLSETPLASTAHWLPPTSPIHLPSSYLSSFVSATSNKKVIDRTFGLSPGFYWQTVETQECVCKGRETTQELHIEVSFTLWCALLLHPTITHHTLQLVLDAGLDVCGLRLLYPPEGVRSNCIGAEPVIQRADETCRPVLALAVRGPHAHSVMKDLTRCLDPMLLKKTERESPLLYFPQLASQVHRELCLWFSGRLRGGRAQNHSHPNKFIPSGDRAGRSLFNVRSSALLCATTKGDVLLVVSPIVPPCCYVQVLAVCERRGFSLRGLQRLQLQSNGAAVLGLTNQQALVYCSPPTVALDHKEPEFPSHCLVLILRKENALCHSGTLPAALMREFEAQQLLGCIRSRRNDDQAVEPSLCFHTVPYNSNLFHIFVRCMWAVPNPSEMVLSRKKCPFKFNIEQVVIFTLCGKDMNQGLSFLHRVLTERQQEGDVRYSAFELLGLKWLPVLTRLQAQGLSPYEVGEQLYQSSLDSLMSSPVLVCAVKRTDASASLWKLLPHDYPGDLSILMSPTPEVAFRQASLFFFDHEMIPVPQVQLTVFLFKPSVWNHTLATTLNNLQRSGLMLVGLRVVTLDRSDANSLLSAENDPSDLEARVQFLCSGSSLAVCLKGENAVQRLLNVLDQEDSSLWTACYGSGTYQRAIEDVKRLFPEGLCCAETSIMRWEQILSLFSDSLASVVREQSCTLAPAAKEELSPLIVSGPNGVPRTLIHITVWQTTCLLLPLNVSTLSQVPPQLDMLEQLLRSGCHLVAGRLSRLDNEQREHIARTLLLSGNERMTRLDSAPCLIIALQGEKVVTGFNLILQSIYKERSDLQEVGETMIYPESEKEAEQLICYLFDALSPESCYTIHP